MFDVLVWFLWHWNRNSSRWQNRHNDATDTRYLISIISCRMSLSFIVIGHSHI